MKIFSETPLAKANMAVIQGLSDDYLQYVTYEIGRFTRIDKVSEFLEEALSNGIRALELRGHQPKVIEALENASKLGLSTRIETVVLDHSLFLDDSHLSEELNELMRSDVDVFLHMRKSSPQRFEQLFRRYADNNIKGIAFHVEFFTRGQIALAHRFELETLITEVKFERHYEKVKKSDTDAYVIAQSS